MSGGPDLRSIVSKANKIESYAQDVEQWVDMRVGELEQEHGVPLPEHLQHPYNVMEAQMAVVCACMKLAREVVTAQDFDVDEGWIVAEALSAARASHATSKAGERFIDLEAGRGYSLEALKALLAGG